MCEQKILRFGWNSSVSPYLSNQLPAGFQHACVSFSKEGFGSSVICHFVAMNDSWKCLVLFAVVYAEMRGLERDRKARLEMLLKIYSFIQNH